MMPQQQNEIFVTFWGTRGSISTPGRTTEKYGGNTPCVSLRHRNVVVILDAGTGIRNLGIELLQGADLTEKDLSLHLFLSHTHWDHIQGLPFFQPAYVKDTRLTIYGSQKKEHFLDSILKKQMNHEYFPVTMSAFSASIAIQEICEEAISIGPMLVGWQEQVYHPGGSVRYRFIAMGKKIVYATDIELDEIFRNKDKEGKKQTTANDYLAFIEGADLLIADGQYTEEEYRSKVGWGHSSISLLLDTAFLGRVKQVAVFHHDPQHSDRFLDDLWVKNRSRYYRKDHRMEVFWAREGLTIGV